MTWAKFIDLCGKSADFKEEIDKAIVNQHTDKPREFIPMDVASSASFGVEISTHGLALDRSDITELSGKTPEELKLKMHSVTDSAGKVHKVLLCRDAAHPYRTFRAFSKLEDSSEKLHLKADEQLFGSQGSRLLKTFRTGRGQS